MKGVPAWSTRLAMLKRQEADIAFALDGPIANGVRRYPNLKWVDVRRPAVCWIACPEPWEPRSPWADIRLRQAIHEALDRQASREAAGLGDGPPAGVITDGKSHPGEHQPIRSGSALGGRG